MESSASTRLQVSATATLFAALAAALEVAREAGVFFGGGAFLVGFAFEGFALAGFAALAALVALATLADGLLAFALLDFFVAMIIGYHGSALGQSLK